MAPALECAEGFPQDSICRITATRFGSRAEALAHLAISLAQYCTSRVKMGEMFVASAWVLDAAAEVVTGVLNARMVIRKVMKNTARMERE